MGLYSVTSEVFSLQRAEKMVKKNLPTPAPPSHRPRGSTKGLLDLNQKSGVSAWLEASQLIYGRAALYPHQLLRHRLQEHDSANGGFSEQEM